MHNKKLNLFLLIFATVFFPRLFCSQKLQPVLERKTYADTKCLNIATSKDPLSWDLNSQYYTCWNQSHFSTFGFNQEKPVDIKNGHFLDMKIRDFLPKLGFKPVNWAKLKLYLFPFDLNNQATINIEGENCFYTLTDQDTLKITSLIPNYDSITSEEKEPFITRTGYFSWTKTCVTLCQVDEETKIDFTNGYMFDQSKTFFLPTDFTAKAYLNFKANCPQGEAGHSNNKFSLFILPFDKNGQANFVDSQNQMVMLTVIYPALKTIEKVQNQNLLEEKKEKIEQVDPQNPLISDDTKNVNTVEPAKKQNPDPKASPTTVKNSSTTTAEIKPKNSKPKSSFFSNHRWKVVCGSLLLGLFLIATIIKKGFAFYNQR